MVSLFQHTARLKRLLEVLRLSAEGEFQEKTNAKKCSIEAACAGGVGLNKQAELRLQYLRLQNPCGNRAGLGTDSLLIISTRWHHRDCDDHLLDFATNGSLAIDKR